MSILSFATIPSTWIPSDSDKHLKYWYVDYKSQPPTCIPISQQAIFHFNYDIQDENIDIDLHWPEEMLQKFSTYMRLPGSIDVPIDDLNACMTNLNKSFDYIRSSRDKLVDIRKSLSVLINKGVDVKSAIEPISSKIENIDLYIMNIIRKIKEISETVDSEIKQFDYN